MTLTPMGIPYLAGRFVIDSLGQTMETYMYADDDTAYQAIGRDIGIEVLTFMVSELVSGMKVKAKTNWKAENPMFGEDGDAYFREVFVDEDVQWVSEGGLKSSFADNLGDVLKKEGLSLDEFNKLRLTDVDELKPNEIAKMKAIREAVPKIDSETIIQKTIPAEDLAKYL